MPAKRSTRRKAAKRAPRIQRVRPNALRTLGAERRSKPSASKKPGSGKAIEVLRAEFDRVMTLKDKLAAETRIGATEKAREPRRADEKLRSLVASLEGMNRFALQMGLITPAQSRELYAGAMKRGLYQGWK